MDREGNHFCARLHTQYDFNFTGEADVRKAADALAEKLGVDPVADPEGEGEAAFAAAMDALVAASDLERFKAAAREVLATPACEPRLTVGPVIGKVTETTARILVESSHDGDITCTLTPDSGDPVSVGWSLTRWRPTVITFGDLAPATRYEVSFDGVEMLASSSSFRTTPEGGWRLADGQTPKVIMASCNSVYTSRKSAHDSPGSLWQHLMTDMQSGEKPSPDYFVHLGDNVYNDIEWCVVEKGKAELEGYECKWGLAHEWLKDVPAEEWAGKIPDIEELFRTVYRETWTYPPQRWVLANVPNLMIFDDHDMRDDWGDRDVDTDENSMDVFLANIAYRLVLEYQKQLYMDIGEDPYRDFHFHAFGDIGIMFLDLRACKTFHKQPIDDAAPMLGNRQWRALEDSLMPDQGGNLYEGLFKDCKALLVISPEPVAYVSSKPTTAAGETVCDDLLGQWSAPKHCAEVPRLMKALTSWRKQEPDRQVLLVGGDVHEGGWTDVSMACDDEAEEAELLVKQLTTSAISNKITEHHEAIAVIMTRDVASAIDGFNICGGWRFQHFDWTNWRNYAELDFELNDASKMVIGGTLIASDGETVKRCKRHTSEEPPQTTFDRATEVAKHCAGHAKGMFKKFWG